MRKIKIARFLASSIAFFLLTGCVSMYSAPRNSEATAEIEFVDRYTGAGRGHIYYWHTTGTCEERSGEGQIAALDWLNGQSKQSTLTAGERGYLLAHRQALQDVAAIPSGTQFTSGYCRRLVSFVPIAGKRYRAEMSDLPQCTLSIVDASTGEPVDSIQQHEVGGRCSAQNL